MVVLVTVAVLVGLAVVDDGTVYSRVKVAEAPDVSGRSGHVLWSSVGCLWGAVPSVKPAGKASLTETPRASDGPLLCTVIVYVCVTPSPAVTAVTPDRKSVV